MNTQWKALIAPIFSIVFVAGGGWVTLDAVAQQNTELTERVHKVEEKVGQQQVIEVKVQQVQDRLERMEVLVDKMVEIQQRQMTNQAAICQATGANCR